ncbi:hypothetical protein HEP87_60315 [Streptomyces sp. S1D4-11]
MTGRQEPYYVDYDADFGLSGLTEAFTLSPAPQNTGAALGLVTAKLDAYDRECPVGSVDHLSADERSILGYDTSHDEWGYAEELRETCAGSSSPRWRTRRSGPCGERPPGARGIPRRTA